MWLKILFLLAIPIGIGVAFYAASKKAEPNNAELLHASRQEMREGKFAAAQKSIEKLLKRTPTASEALILAGEIQMRQNQTAEALELFGNVPKSPTADYATAQFTRGEIYRSLGNLTLSEEAYNEALTVSPELSIAHERLAFIKRMTGRVLAAEENLKFLLTQQQITPEQLAWLAAPDQIVNVQDFLTTCVKAVPDDPLPMFGLGMNALNQGRLKDAEDWLRKGISIQRNPEAIASLGRSLFEQDNEQRLQDWEQSLTQVERSHPSVQYLLGLIQERNGRSELAITYFARTLNTIADHQGALNHLATLLKQNHKDASVAEVFTRVQLVSRLNSILGSINPQQPNSEAAAQIAAILARLGRAQEAALWGSMTGFPPPPVTTNQLEQHAAVQRTVQSLASRSIEETNSLETPLNRPKKESSASQFHFIDQAAATGIRFQYFESPDPDTEGRRMFEFTGGGVGVLDFDLDGWSDLYFTQGTDWSPSAKNIKHRDALYRQVDLRFERIDDLAELEEVSFSQGVSVGDLNNDGFPDLYVANFGANSCYLNNGDGTFSRSDDPQIRAATDWTTSCLIADLNSDGSPDIFEVNYLQGGGIVETICETKGGQRVCSPLAFQSTNDRLLISQGNGSFEDSSAQSGIVKPGNGLGIVAANFDQDPELEIFIGNDLMENFFWDREPNNASLTFAETALLRGWAFGSEGEVQACMGIAAADFNHDAQLDLFVTNYFNESNSLYLVDGTGFTQDQATSFGLRTPSLPMLGFGTQALDADLDGDWDLVITNGDLDDFSHENRQFQMPPQLFENLQNKRFQEVSTKESRSYFSKTYRGRGLAKVDWNRDGRCDFAVSHLDQPAALVTNLTEPIGEFISLKLVGTTSSRDAIGTTVTLTAGDDTWYHQLTAGDGYQSSNERKLLFALPESQAMTLKIRWPSGVEETNTIPARVGRYMAVEGQGLTKEAWSEVP